jgi:tRNA-Thr(GGU) m(6)t(6)A37 methyltransferase TsaA
MDREILLHSIGFVENDIDEMVAPAEIKAVPSRIVLNQELMAGLNGLQAGQTLLILFHFHRAPASFELHQHPQRDTSRPKRGIFALRSPQRPNRIGVTEVELARIEGHILYVNNLDAINGSPVIDIKPVYDDRNVRK